MNKRRWAANLLDCQTLLVEQALEIGLFDESEIENQRNGTERCVADWYLVDPDVVGRLREAGLVILANNYGVWWGCEDPDFLDDLPVI
jgi:hypothetical protein